MDPYIMAVLEDALATADIAEAEWIQKAAARMKRKGTEGLFSSEAEKRGMTTRQFADEVLANPEQYGPKWVKRANFARNAMKASK